MNSVNEALDKEETELLKMMHVPDEGMPSFITRIMEWIRPPAPRPPSSIENNAMREMFEDTQEGIDTRRDQRMDRTLTVHSWLIAVSLITNVVMIVDPAYAAIYTALSWAAAGGAYAVAAAATVFTWSWYIVFTAVMLILVRVSTSADMKETVNAILRTVFVATPIKQTGPRHRYAPHVVRAEKMEALLRAH